jgi:uncharacterized protein (DUF2267 family)
MQTTRRLIRTVEVAAGAIGLVAVAMPDSGLGRSTRRVGARIAHDLRYMAASTPGVLYRAAGRRPDPDVSDDILADRIRSGIGPLEHRLDIPHVHVMVEDHIALLHGEVPDENTAETVERAVLRVSGVRGIESHLHPGLLSSDTRPSEGRRHPKHSDALHALTDAARSAGAQQPESAVHAVLCGFFERIPDDERTHIYAHLPADVRRLAGPPRQIGERSPRLKTLAQVVASVTAEGGIEPERAEAITRAVVTTLRAIVPDEQRDIAAVLPGELRQFWVAESADRG